MQEIGKRIGLLRLLLADIEAKKVQLQEIEGQYRAQLSRIIDFVVYRDGDVANALSLMSEVQGKLDEVLQSSEHLLQISEKANVELEVLVLTRSVTDARVQLAELEKRQQELSSKLLSLSGGSLIAVPERPTLGASQVQDIRGIHDEVTDVASEIARLNQLITEASDRAARTIQAASHTPPKPGQETARKRDTE